MGLVGLPGKAGGHGISLNRKIVFTGHFQFSIQQPLLPVSISAPRSRVPRLAWKRVQPPTFL